MTSTVPFHPIALLLGFVGAVLVAAGILGAVEAPNDWLPVLARPEVWLSLLVLGGLLVVAEVVLVIVGIRNRASSR